MREDGGEHWSLVKGSPYTMKTKTVLFSLKVIAKIDLNIVIILFRGNQIG